MAISIYRSTDASAPTLSGSAGALITVLDAVLVNGYGAKSALGWTKAYSGVNLASYVAASGIMAYLGVDDTGTTTARIRGFQTMTAAGVAVASGTNPFPTDVQFSGGLYVLKSSAASGAARPWVIISNGVMIYLFIDSNALGTNNNMSCFGDFSSYNVSDTGNAIIIANTSGSAAYQQFSGVAVTPNNVLAGHYALKKYDLVSWSTPIGKSTLHYYGRSANAMLGQASTLLVYPDPIIGGAMLSPIILHELEASLGVLRGRLPGIWSLCHPSPFNTGDTLSGDAGTDLNGKTFEYFALYGFNSLAYNGSCLIETSDTWDDINFR